MSQMEQLRAWWSKGSSKALVFIVVAVVFGYQVGKDMALRDNAEDRRATELERGE